METFLYSEIFGFITRFVTCWKVILLFAAGDRDHNIISKPTLYLGAKLPAHKPSVIYFEHYLHNIFKIPIFTSTSSATSLIRNTVASCLYYPNSHSAGFWFHFCHPSSLVFNTAAALILVNLKPGSNASMILIFIHSLSQEVYN